MTTVFKLFLPIYSPLNNIFWVTSEIKWQTRNISAVELVKGYKKINHDVSIYLTDLRVRV